MGITKDLAAMATSWQGHYTCSNTAKTMVDLKKFRYGYVIILLGK